MLGAALALASPLALGDAEGERLGLGVALARALAESLDDARGEALARGDFVSKGSLRARAQRRSVAKLLF
jgi:hypothetical protein